MKRLKSSGMGNEMIKTVENILICILGLSFLLIVLNVSVALLDRINLLNINGATNYLENLGYIVYGVGEEPSTNFTGLTDTPASYAGEAGKYVRVNLAGNALEFNEISGNLTIENLSFNGTITGSVFELTSLLNGKYYCDYASLITLTAGENITAGEIVYMAADGDVNLADASANATMEARWLALETIEDTDTGLFMKEGYYRNTGWSETPGADAWVSATAGLITSTRPVVIGNQVQKIGKFLTREHGIPADIVYLHFASTVVEVP